MSAVRDSYRQLAESVLRAARTAGAQDAILQLNRSEFCEAGFRDGSLEKASASSKQSLSLRLFVDGRFAAHQTSDLRMDELRRFVEQAVKLTRLLEPDPQRGLPESRYVAIPPAPDLKLYDEALAQTPAQHWIDLAQRSEAAVNQRAAQEKAPLVSSQGGAYGESAWELLASSNGFVGELEESVGYVVCSVAFLDPQDKAKRRQGWRAGLNRQAKGLGSPGQLTELADDAVSRALWGMGARPGPTGRFPIVVENRVAGNLIGQWMQGLGGQAVYHKRSYLGGQTGQKVASGLFSLRDVPGMPGGLASRWFDREGMAAKEFDLIQEGVLRNYYLDTYFARKLDLNPTTASYSNLIIPASLEASGAELCAGLDEGLLITGFLGGNYNPTSGDFSYGVSGQWFKNGSRERAIEGMNLSGNARSFWQELSAVGNDPYELSSMLSSFAHAQPAL